LNYNWVDIVLAIALLGSVISGYRAGFLKSIFSMVGFIGGGVLGLGLGLHFLANWHNAIGKFSTLLVLISLASNIGKWVFERVAKFFHNTILFGPFKWLDSLLGAAFSFIRTALAAFLIASLCLAMPWTWAHEKIAPSKIYQKINLYTPGLIRNVTDQITKTF
jgi:uncharacterized membrane protein required for colicin V production